jgi:peptidoglycan/LPS O-acetylase OafA/YrhL
MSSLLAPAEAAEAVVAAPLRAGRRAEVDGLRALAVALVVGYHVFTGRVSGGVDVFLALSGFFLVHSLAGRLARTGRIDPLTAIVRTLSRLAPAAVLVLAATAVAGAWVMPETRWRELAEHLASSVTFTENLRLVDEAVDYAANDAAASPMQQFWSLSIQVQVLLAVPVVVAAATVVLRGRWRRYGRPLAVVVVTGVTVASFVWSVLATRADQQAAYFSTLPRLWELGVGALAALLLSRARPGRRLGAVLGWGGVLALIACGAVLDGAERFPGWEAAWPVLCAVAVLLAADTGGRLGVHRILSLRPLQWLGLRSYALYLWHWPVLVLYLAYSDGKAPSFLGAAGVIALSVVLAAATLPLLERPAERTLRSRRPVWALLLVAVCAAPVLGAGLGTTSWLDREAARTPVSVDDPAHPGARALHGGQVATAGVADAEPAPALSVIREDWPQLSGARCVDEDRETQRCVLGSDDRARRIVVVGDSHVAHWLSPLSALAEKHDWQVVSIIRGSCNLSTESELLREGDPNYRGCASWRSGLVDRIVSLEPDLVISLGTRTAPGGRPETLPPGFVAAWQKLSDAGVPVIGMRDTPRHAVDVPDCVAEHGDRARQCELSRSAVYDDEVMEAAAAVLPPGVRLLDTSSYFCTDTVCPTLTGNVRVYMDFAHVTATYMRTVGPVMEADFLALTGWGTGEDAAG